MIQNFHDNKLWQQSYVALIDIHKVFEETDDMNDMDEEVVDRLITAGGEVASRIADGLSRTDRRFGRNLVYDAIGLTAVVRTQLAIAWGRGLLDDPTFKKIDDQYAKLSEELQNFK